MRSLLRDRTAWKTLKERPDLTGSDDVVMELLRRDNHVKALSRQFDQAMQLDGFTIEAGEVVCLYFPGINMDHNHWNNPCSMDFERRFTGENNIIFGGSFYTCIGRKLTMAFLGNMVAGFLRHLPDSAKIIDGELEIDGSWMAERIITRMPIHLG